jgi:hypothetical protein
MTCDQFLDSREDPLRPRHRPRTARREQALHVDAEMEAALPHRAMNQTLSSH